MIVAPGAKQRDIARTQSRATADTRSFAWYAFSERVSPTLYPTTE